jgi:pimeloyl-ACP methyl ester carboxylesterase
MSMGQRRITRHPYMIAFREQAGFKDTYGGDEGWVFIEAMRIAPRDVESRTVVVFSHPIGGGAFLPVMSALARAGHHVVYCNTRYRGNDTALIMEKCVVDLGACIADLRGRFGYERVILGGWSGGGSLALYYQEQAERPSVASTPAGDPPDLTAEKLIPADAIFLVAAHVSRSATLTEWLDASVVDERDREARDPELDLYDAGNRNRPPYTQAFLERYRNAQIARNRRITQWVEETLASLRSAGRSHEEVAFVVHGTMADPRWLDPSVDPNGRTPGRCYLGDPRLVNNSPVGLARFSTLRSWLSQWSLDRSRAHGERNAAGTCVPTLVVGNGADDACTPSHARRLFDAIPHERKEAYTIAGASHYYMGQDALLAECVGLYASFRERYALTD